MKIYTVYEGDVYSLEVRETTKCYVPALGKHGGKQFEFRSRWNKEYDRIFLTAQDAYTFYLERYANDIEEIENKLNKKKTYLAKLKDLAYKFANND